MRQRHLQSQNSSFQTIIKVKQRACPSLQGSQLSWRHAVHPWVGTELAAAAPALARGQEHSKRRMGWMVLAASEAGPCMASAEGTCLGRSSSGYACSSTSKSFMTPGGGDVAGGWQAWSSCEVCGCWG